MGVPPRAWGAKAYGPPQEKQTRPKPGLSCALQRRSGGLLSRLLGGLLLGAGLLGRGLLLSLGRSRGRRSRGGLRGRGRGDGRSRSGGLGEGANGEEGSNQGGDQLVHAMSLWAGVEDLLSSIRRSGRSHNGSRLARVDRFGTVRKSTDSGRGQTRIRKGSGEAADSQPLRRDPLLA